MGIDVVQLRCLKVDHAASLRPRPPFDPSCDERVRSSSSSWSPSSVCLRSNQISRSPIVTMSCKRQRPALAAEGWFPVTPSLSLTIPPSPRAPRPLRSKIVGANIRVPGRLGSGEDIPSRLMRCARCT